jgi:hypothetical protein
MRSIGWNVYRNGRLIDTVFFDADISASEVKRSLVEHDGYPPNIIVRK